MKIYCTYCKTPTHADTSCPYQLKEKSVHIVPGHKKEINPLKEKTMTKQVTVMPGGSPSFNPLKEQSK